MSDITYVRTMKLTYPVKVDSMQMRRLAAQLHKKGMSMVEAWKWLSSPPKDEDYGFRTIKEDKTRHWVVLNDKRVYAHRSISTIDDIVESIQDAAPELTAMRQREDYVKTEKIWVKPKGQWIWLTMDDMDGEMIDCNVIGYSDNVKMKIDIGTTWNDEIYINFKLYWVTEKVQRKDKIEQMLVDIPLGDMGRMQAAFESILRTKKFGSLREEPIIDCKFDAKTHTTSECAPDIIAKVRNARTA